MAESKKKTLDDFIEQFEREEVVNNAFDLDNWISDFEDGFPLFIKSNPLYKNHYWGFEFNSRPKIRELNLEPNAVYEEGYRLIEFFPTRNNEEESYTLFGTPLELMTQLSLFMNQWLFFRNNGFGNSGWLLEFRLKGEKEKGDEQRKDQEREKMKISQK